MQSDDLIWDVIGPGFCSFRVKNVAQNFCRNEFNVTGLCNRSSCPLANSQYATIREMDGSCYLYVKTIERAHLPSRLWERIKLSRSYERALEQIDQELQYWPDQVITKCKQRLTQILQYLKRMQMLQMQDGLPELIPRKKKQERREKTREQAAEQAARIEQTIEKEILDRLKSGTYGDIYNFNQKAFELALDQQEEELEEEEEEEEEREFVEFDEEAEDVEDLFGSSTKYLDDYCNFEEDDDEEEEEESPKKPVKKLTKRKKSYEIEYEQEDDQIEKQKA